MTAPTYSNVLLTGTLVFCACFGIIHSSMNIVEILPNATDVEGDVENRMAYWREDLGLNSFHWHWHMYHPWSTNLSKPFIIKKDRRGELFFYFHQQFVARFLIERFCNNLNYVTPFSNWDTPIPGSYTPMLSSEVAGQKWSPRPASLKLGNINRSDAPGGAKFTVNDMKLFKNRVLKAIEQRKLVYANGTEIDIDNDRGIVTLANTVESVNILTPNFDYYGFLHNSGHFAIGHILDPQKKHNTPPGVMWTPNTAVRDPVFYRWHVFINNIFQKHKATLQTYNERMLSFPNVRVTNVELCSLKNGKCTKEKNTLTTYMMKSDFNMSRGIDFIPRKPVLVRITHKNHDEFEYRIEYFNYSLRKLLGTVRIFLIPVIGFDNKPMQLSEQRPLAVEMDRFVQRLKPGLNKIVRKSTMSSVTIPYEQTFRDLDTNRPKDSEYEKLDIFNACGCGWPHHLLVPKGTAKGYPMLLFSMITDYERDRNGGDKEETENNCRISIFCASRHQKYPYKLPNGFPFDRPIRNNVDTIQDFLTPNMAIKPITIFHSDKYLSYARQIYGTVLKQMNFYDITQRQLLPWWPKQTQQIRASPGLFVRNSDADL